MSGLNPNGGRITTSTGLREPRAPLCEAVSGGHRSSAILVRNGNGQMICPDHMGSQVNGVVDGFVIDESQSVVNPVGTIVNGFPVLAATQVVQVVPETVNTDKTCDCDNGAACTCNC